MASTLDYLNDESIARELIRKTKGCGFIWTQESSDSFKNASYEEKDNGVVILWEFLLSKTNDKFALDVFRNTNLYSSVVSDALEELYDLLFDLISSGKNKQEILSFIQSTPDCISPAVLPIKLKPNSDLIDPGWKRVPANGFKYEKVREDVLIHDGDATFIYDDVGTEMQFGFDQLPPESPDTFDIIEVEIVVKNISGSPTLEGELSIEVPNQTVWTMPFTSGSLNTSYETVIWNWTDTFTKEQINYLRIKFNSIPGVNRVTAIQANVNVNVV
jgi:hypothetical protein